MVAADRSSSLNVATSSLSCSACPESSSANPDISSAAEPLKATVTYQLDLLTAIGMSPRFDVCVQCGRTEDLTHFSSHEGGAVCRHCEANRVEKREVAPDTFRVLRREVDLIAPVPPFALLNYHIAHLMGRQPRLAAKLVSPAHQRLIQPVPRNSDRPD